MTDQDVRAAQAAIDAWMATPFPPESVRPLAEALLELRGILAGWAADLREAGYAEGVAAGRVEGSRLTSRIVLDALHGEGLA